jgi:hypothetical protein
MSLDNDCLWGCDAMWSGTKVPTSAASIFKVYMDLEKHIMFMNVNSILCHGTVIPCGYVWTARSSPHNAQTDAASGKCDQYNVVL